MKKILHIISSIHGETSSSSQLSNTIVENLKNAYPDSQVNKLDLSESHFPYLEAKHFEAFFTPAEHHTAIQREVFGRSGQAITELKEADFIVIGLPIYNLGIPASLKGWIDYVARVGETFSYVDNAPIGLLTDKKVYLAIASGGIYSEEPMKSYDFTEPYLRAMLGFIGLTDLTAFRVEGTAIPGVKDTALSKAQETVSEFTF